MDSKEKPSIEDKFKKLLEGEDEEEKRKQLMLNESVNKKHYVGSFCDKIGISFERSVELYLIMEQIMKTTTEGSEAVIILEKRLDLTNTEKLFIAFKMGTFISQNVKI